MSAFSAEDEFVPRLPAHPLRADARISPSFRRLIANSGHSPLSGVGIEDHLNLVIEFDLQAYFNAATNKTR